MENQTALADLMASFITMLTPEEVEVFRAHPEGIKRQLAHRMKAFKEREVYQLDYSNVSTIIRRLVEEGGPWGRVHSQITDAEFPQMGEGIVDVQYRFIPGEDIKLPGQKRVLRAEQIDARFLGEWLFRPTMAEALLFAVRNRTLGAKTNRPTIMLLDELWVLKVTQSGLPGGPKVRTLELTTDKGTFPKEANYVGVCR